MRLDFDCVQDVYGLAFLFQLTSRDILIILSLSTWNDSKHHDIDIDCTQKIHCSPFPDAREI